MKKLKYWTGIVILGLLSFSAYSAPEKTEPENLNQIMAKIGETMVLLYPMIFSEDKLETSQNQKLLDLAKKLKNLFSQAQPFIAQKSPTYQMSFQLLSDYLDSVVNNDNPAFLPQIKYRLRSLGDFCVSCHTQDNKFRTLFTNIKQPNLSNTLAYAEFNFATRNYLVAHDYYEKYLLLTPNLPDGDVLKALHRILTIFVQVLNDPHKALEIFTQFKNMEVFSDSIKSYITGVVTALNMLSEEKLDEIKIVTFRELQEYVTRFLGDSNANQPFIISTPQLEIERLWLRGLLFRYLNNSPQAEQMPMLLYWLALCDRSLGYGYDYTLADFYIRQCITRYSSHPFARRCFEEYKGYVEFYFTTPTEPIVPIEIHRELNELEKYLK